MDKLEGIKTEFLGLAKDFSHQNTLDIYHQFQDLAALIDTVKDMLRKGFALDEITELMKIILKNIDVLELDLKLNQEERPDQMTQDTLDKMARFKTLFN